MKKIIRILWFCILLPTGVLGQEREFSSHGYIDMEFEYDTEEKVSTFDSKHFNIVSTYTFDQFRVFSEIEWEHGTVLEDNPADSEGEVAVERAWLEYVRSDRLKLRAGKFITPFGIYNYMRKVKGKRERNQMFFIDLVADHRYFHPIWDDLPSSRA